MAIMEGDLAAVEFVGVLQLLSQQRSSGVLTIQASKGAYSIIFEEGKIVGASSTMVSSDEVVIQILVKNSVLSNEEYEKIKEKASIEGRRLIDVAIEEGFISREEFLSGVRDYIKITLREVIKLKEGKFYFYPGDDVACEEGLTPVLVHEVIVNALRESDDAEKLPSMHSSYQRLELADIKVIGIDGTPDLDTDEIWLSPAEKEVLDQFDGFVKAIDLAKIVGWSEFEMLHFLYRMVNAGILEPVDPIEEAEDTDLSAIIESTATDTTFDLPSIETHVSTDVTIPVAKPFYATPVPFILLLIFVIISILLLDSNYLLNNMYPFVNSNLELKKSHFYFVTESISTLVNRRAVLEGELPKEMLFIGFVLGKDSSLRDGWNRIVVYKGIDKFVYSLAPIEEGSVITEEERSFNLGTNVLVNSEPIKVDKLKRLPIRFID